MASESGFSNQLKKGSSQFKTIHSLGSNKFGQSVASKALFEKVPAQNIVSVADIDGINGQVEFQIVNMPGHGALAGDILRIDAGDLINFEFDILEIIDTDNFKILALVDSGLQGSIASIMGWVTNKANQDGSQIVALAPTAIAFNRDSVLTEVVEDTATPASNIALPSAMFVTKDGIQYPVTKDTATPSNTVAVPVEIVSASGSTINITAGDINIQTTDLGASFDSMRIGDGTGNYQGFTALAEAKTNDSAARTSLGSIDTKLTSQATAAKQDLLLAELQLKADLTETQPVSLASIPLATGAATAANQATEIASLSSIDTKLTSQATAALQGTGNTSLGSIDTKLTSQATAALQTAQSTLFGAVTETAPASDTASSGLNGRLQRIAQRITSLIALLPASLGQKTMANSLAVTLASDQGSINSNSTRATVAGTVTQASITVGTTAVRATVAGTAPNAARKRLSIKPSENNTGTIFLGSSTVTTANGMSFIGPDRIDFEFDSGDYYLISDVAGQSVQIIEKV